MPPFPSRPLTEQPSLRQPNAPREDQPSYQLRFTCKPCGGRSSHKVTKQGYHRGTVLITCPQCKNRHLIADHLRVFSDTSITIEDLLREKGQLLKKGTLGAGEDGDVEFWEDGTETPHLANDSLQIVNEVRNFLLQSAFHELAMPRMLAHDNRRMCRAAEKIGLKSEIVGDPSSAHVVLTRTERTPSFDPVSFKEAQRIMEYLFLVDTQDAKEEVARKLKDHEFA